MGFSGHCLCGKVTYKVDMDAPLITAYGELPTKLINACVKLTEARSLRFMPASERLHLL